MEPQQHLHLSRSDKTVGVIAVTTGTPVTLTRAGRGREHTIGQDMDPLWELQVQREGKWQHGVGTW